MTIKKQLLFALLSKEYKPCSPVQQLLYSSKALPAIQQDQVCKVYQELKGICTPVSEVISPGLNFESIRVYLDEETNFNRYRLTTLQSSFYQSQRILIAEKYKSYCRTFEKECLKAASHQLAWTHPQAEKAFGPSGDHGDLSLQGAAAWKRRAFEDFLTDVIHTQQQEPCIRISIWDNLLINAKMYRVNDLLLTSRFDLKDALLKHLMRRISEVCR